MKKIRVYLFFLLGVSIATSCVQSNIKNGRYNNDATLELGEIEESQLFADKFDDFTIVPLENNREGLLSDVYKMQVTDSGMYFFDNASYPLLLLYSHEGDFKNRIGELGHKKSEYTNISNFSAHATGDAIDILDFNSLKTFSSNGSFISSITLEDEYGWDDLAFVPGGVMLATYHRGYDFLVSMFDSTFENRKNLLPVSSELIKGAMWGLNRLQCVGEKVCFLDPCNSTFYLFDINHLDDIHRIVLKSPNMLTEKVARENDGYLNGGYNFVQDFVYDGESILGTMSYEGRLCDFEIDLEKNAITLGNHIGFNYSFLCYYDGYYYKLLSPFQVLSYLEGKKPYMKESQRILEAALGTKKAEISEYDNYYVLKMKRRSK